MFTLSKMKGTGDCLRRTAIEAGRKDLFDNRGRRNLKQFRAWIHFLFVESCDSCQLSMWRVFQLLYIGSQGQCPSYDRLVIIPLCDSHHSPGRKPFRNRVHN
jgi:hypothetical protein